MTNDSLNKKIEALKKIISEQPNYTPALNSLGALFYTLGKLDDAIHYYQLALEKEPAYIDAYYNLGLALIKQQHYDKAISTYQLLLTHDPNHAAAHFQLASALMLSEKIDDALKQFLLIEENYPNHLETQTNLATCYLKKGLLSEAKSHYLKALELAPDDTQILFNLAVINMQQGNTDIAIQQYQQVVSINPNYFPAHNNLGVAFLSKNHIGFALRHFQTALELQPHHQAIRHTIQVLSKDQHLLTSPPEYITTLFDAYADHYESHLLSALDYQVPNILFEVAKKCVSLPSEQWTILDIGCGTGLCGTLFKPYAKKLIGIDLSANMLALAKQKNCYNELITGDFISYLADYHNTFDLIIAGDVLVYIGDLTDSFKNISSALLNNGLFIFNTEITGHATPGFEMTQSGRFVHQKNYIEQLAKQYHFKILSYQTAMTRQQNNEPVQGHIFVLQKK